MDSSAKDVEELLALQARYATAYDSRQPDEFAEVFTVDGRLVLPDGGVLEGREALRSFAAAAAARTASTHHFMTNERIRVSGDTATGAAHVTAVSRVGDSVRLLIIGRYEDLMQRTDAGWRLRERRIVALTADDLPA